MGGTDSEKEGEIRPVKAKEDVSEAISKLLNDFNSAALLKGSLDLNSNSNSASKSAGCEEISSSLKNLHLRKPADSRKKIKDKRNSARKGKVSVGNKYNLSVAAVNVQRSVVWPGKLNNSSKKEDVSLLQPSRLSLCAKEKDKATLSPLASAVGTSSVEERSRIASELIKQNIHQFGHLSESEQNHPSFSNLSEKHSNSEISSGSNLPTTSTGKRTNSCSVPAAKHRRLYNEVHVGSDIGQCFDYRCSYSLEDNAQLKETNSSSDTPSIGSASRVQEQDESSSSCPSVGRSSERTFSCDEEEMEMSNVNELAYYFDDLLHIPKKMSVMAEMMYA